MTLPTGPPLSGPPWNFDPPEPIPAGVVTISSSLITAPSGNRSIGPLHIALTPTGTDEALELVFAAAGSQTVTQPPGATCCVINPPAGNTVGLTLMGADGMGLGIPIAPNLPAELPFPTTNGGATFMIAASGAITGAVAVDFA